MWFVYWITDLNIAAAGVQSISANTTGGGAQVSWIQSENKTGLHSLIEHVCGWPFSFYILVSMESWKKSLDNPWTQADKWAEDLCVAFYILNFYSLQKKKEREKFSSCQGKSIQRIHLHNDSTTPNKYSLYFSAHGENEKVGSLVTFILLPLLWV